MLIQIFSKPHHVCFVHTDMQPLGCVYFTQRRKHIVDQFVRARLLCQKNVVAINNRDIFSPASDTIQMRQRLYTGDQLHAKPCGIGVQFRKLCLRIPTAQISEIRLVIHFVSVLSI